MKKRILIITEALGYGIGGSEKALIEMLNLLDSNKYDISVLSLNNAPKAPYYNDKIQIKYGCEDYLKMCQPFLLSVQPNKWRYFSLVQLFAKLWISIYTRVHKGELSKFIWETIKPWVNNDSQPYDVVIGYGVGHATYYAVDKTKAKLKIAWLNTSIEDAHLDIKYCRKMYDSVDVVITDSQSGAERFKRLYIDYSKPVYTVRNILNIDEIRAKGNESLGFTDGYDGMRILSVGRITEAKAFHYAVEAASILKRKGYSFKWYIVGFGELENTLKEQIRRLDIEDCFILLGGRTNPYPFFKETDIYVQTSIFEGSCITLEEAMAFFKPIVSTNFAAAYEKLINGVNGFITEMSATSVSNAVEKLLQNQDLRDRFIQHQKDYPLKYDKEIYNFYSIIEDNLKNK